MVRKGAQLGKIILTPFDHAVYLGKSAACPHGAHRTRPAIILDKTDAVIFALLGLAERHARVFGELVGPTDAGDGAFLGFREAALLRGVCGGLGVVLFAGSDFLRLSKLYLVEARYGWHYGVYEPHQTGTLKVLPFDHFLNTLVRV